ncbi:MAG: hypothetical protein AABX32_00595 [Nanoarchaeota archaeon]
MKETILLKIALICSLVGLVALFFISQRIELKDYKPDFLNKNIGESVNLSGKISKITAGNNVVFIELSQQVPVSVVVFTDKNVNLNENDFVEISGKIQSYNGKEEIIADKIKVVS